MPSVMPGSPSSFFSVHQVPRQERLHVLRNLAPDLAQCSKYHVSHFRGLSFHIANVAKIENNAAIS